MLELLHALEEAREELSRRGAGLWELPFAYGVDEAIRAAQDKIKREAEIQRHWLLVCDSALGTRGVRPWEDDDG